YTERSREARDSSSSPWQLVFRHRSANSLLPCTFAGLIACWPTLLGRICSTSGAYDAPRAARAMLHAPPAYASECAHASSERTDRRPHSASKSDTVRHIDTEFAARAASRARVARWAGVLLGWRVLRRWLPLPLRG